MKGDVLNVLFSNCCELNAMDLFVAVDFGIYQRYVDLFLEDIRKDCGLRNYKDIIQEDKWYILSFADLVACQKITGISELKKRYDNILSIFIVRGSYLETFLGDNAENYVVLQEKYYIDEMSVEKFCNACAKNCRAPYDNLIWDMTTSKTEIMKETIEFLRKNGNYTLVECRDLYKKPDKELEELRLSVNRRLNQKVLERVKAESILRSTFGDNYDFLLSDECKNLISLVKNA